MFSINALATGAEIYIYGDIGDDWAAESVSAKSFIESLQAVDPGPLTVRINSVGGSVPDGLAIYNALKRHTGHVTVAIDGMAYSIASLIAMAGDTVQMADNGQIMVHAPWAVVAGNSKALRTRAEQLDKWAEAMATCYARKTGRSLLESSRFLDGNDHFFTAEEAKAERFIDEIMEPIAIAAYGRIPEPAAARFIDPQKLSASQREEFTMPGQAPKNTPALSAAEHDTSRRQEIEANFKPFIGRPGMDSALAKCLMDKDVSVQAANDRLLVELGKDAEPVAGDYHVSPDNWRNLPSGGDRFKEDATAAILTRAGLADEKTRQHAAKTQFGSFTLMDYAKASLDRGGVSHGVLDPMKVVATAFTQTTSDFPVLLENVMHKALMDAYVTAPDTWSRFCHVGSVGDFRTHNRYRTGSIGNYDAVNDAGEFVSKAIPDGEKATIQATTRGNIINLTRQTIINDDVGAFAILAANLGRAGRRTIEAAVYSVLAENSWMGPTMTDGNPLFHADHNNIGSGSALEMTAIDGDRVLLSKQTDVSGNDFLYLSPRVLLVPMELGGTARSLNGAQYDPDSANKLNKPNIVNGLFSDIVDTPRLTGTRRYIFADPMQAPAIEVAFLNGIQEPYIEQQYGFTVDGTLYKARLDFGVAAIDYRGAVTNAGA